jgi:hypothetical protein
VPSGLLRAASGQSRRRRGALALLALLLVALLVVWVTRPPSSSPEPDKEAAAPRPFASSSVWNAPLPRDAPLDPASDKLVGRLNELVKANIDARNGPWINTNEFSAPVYTVGPNQATTRVKLDRDEPALQAAFEKVPIPPDARPANGTDHHMVVWQPSSDRMWEFWIAQKKPDGWHAQWGGAIEHVSKSPGYFTPAAWPGAKNYWGATATSLPLLGGLIRIDEARKGTIDHAVALSLPEIRQGQFSLPAQRTDGNTPGPDAIPEGARFRLDPSLDIEALNLPPLTEAIAKAAQTHGIIVRDYSGVVAFVGEDPAGVAPGQPDPWRAIYGEGKLPTDLLASFPWDRLQLTRMQLSGGQ